MALIVQVVCYKKGHRDQAHHKGDACTWIEEEYGGAERASEAFFSAHALLELSLRVAHRKMAEVKRQQGAQERQAPRGPC